MSMLTREEAKRYGEYVGKLDTMYRTLSGDYDPKDVVAAVFNARHYDKTRKGLARTLLDAGVGYIPKDSNPSPGEVAGLGILDERGRNLQAGATYSQYGTCTVILWRWWGGTLIKGST